MQTACHRRQVKAAFTLVELLTAIAILSILLAFVGLLIGAASKATKLSRERLDADRQARLIFDCMADDFTRMMRRPDVDFHFVKGSTTATPGVNDTFFMFCENPGYFGTGLTSPSAMESNVSLIGYRINTINNPPATGNTPPFDTPYTLERLAKGLTWETQTSSTPTTYPVPFLTLDQLTSSPPNYAPDANSTILGQWPNVDSSQGAYTDSNFHMLGDSTFRLEFCFLLTDGTYSLVPALSTAGSTLNATAAPTGSASGSVGSRWYDTQNNHAYVCTAAPTGGSTVWQPLGMVDVQAVIVAIAILDQTSQQMLGSNSTTLSTDLAAMSAALPNPTAASLSTTPPTLMATTWLNTVNQSTFASSVNLPVAVASQVRIYQRFFYLNNLYNNL